MGVGFTGRQDAIAGLGDQWGADLERIRASARPSSSSTPPLRPPAPPGSPCPETGTPEGERITSGLAETAMRETPGGQTVLAAARAMAPQGPMTADYPARAAGHSARRPPRWTSPRAWPGADQAVPGVGDLRSSRRQAIPGWCPAWRAAPDLRDSRPGRADHAGRRPPVRGRRRGRDAPGRRPDVLRGPPAPSPPWADGVPYRFGRAGRRRSLPDAGLGHPAGPSASAVPRLTPEQQAQRARDGEAEQRVFDAIRAPVAPGPGRGGAPPTTCGSWPWARARRARPRPGLPHRQGPRGRPPGGPRLGRWCRGALAGTASSGWPGAPPSPSWPGGR